MAKKTHISSEAAREAILNAAEHVVVQVGPAGLRISAVAKYANMAHPNIIHHFGSREGLLDALAQRVGDRATRRITAAINRALLAPPSEKLAAMTQILDCAYCGDEGKCAVWLHLSGIQSSLKQNMQRIVQASHQLRKSIDGPVKIENTSRIVLLVTFALVGEVVSGDGIKDALGFEAHDNGGPSFREWLAQLLLTLSDVELERKFSSFTA